MNPFEGPLGRFAVVLAVWTLVTGCAAHESIEGPTGSVGVELNLGGGVMVTSASYSVTGPNGFTTSGTVAVGNSPNVSVVLQSVPVGNGYIISLSALASDGITTCSGSTTFNVSNSAMTTVVVQLNCMDPETTGAAMVNGVLNICPVLDGLSARPAEAVVGGVLSFDAEAHDADNGPSPLAYSWTVGGLPMAGSGPQSSFTCSGAGTFVIGVKVSDGDPNPSCADQLSVSVTCTAP
jgi:hypothetical protein